MKNTWNSIASGLLLSASLGVQAQTVEEATAQAQLEKALAEAQKAKYDAENAATKAKFGTLADYSNQGTTTAGAGAGTLEASLLGAEATLAVGRDIGGAVCMALETEAATDNVSAVYVVAENFVMSFEVYDAFRIQAQAIGEQLAAALAMTPWKAQPGDAELTARTASLGTAAAIVGNLLRSEYSVGNVTLTADDQVLTRAVIDAAPCRGKYAFRLPGQYIAPAQLADNGAMLELKRLDELRRGVEQKLLLETRTRSEGLEAAKAESDKVEAARLRVAAEQYEMPIDAAVKALKAHTAFRKVLSTPNDKGVLPLSLITRQAHLAQTLAKDGYLLVLKANVLGGTSYTKKNFWTFLGSTPFSVTGGTTASYTLIEGRSSNVIDSGVAARAAPYAKVHKTIARFEDGVPEK